MQIKANGTYKAAESQLRNRNKEQLIAYIRTLEHNWEAATEALVNQANYIEEQKTWTPVEKKLPTESNVICTDAHGKMMIGYLDYDESSSTGQICVTDNDEVMNDVVAWMSLPKAYQREREVEADYERE